MEFVGFEDRWCAAPQVQVADFALLPQQVGDQFDLLEEDLQVGTDRGMTPDDLGMAAAKPAQAVAEGNVDIERQRQPRIELGEPLAVRRRLDL